MLYFIILISNSQKKLSWPIFWIWAGIMDIWIYIFQYFCVVCTCVIKYRGLLSHFKEMLIEKAKLSNNQIRSQLLWKLLRICIIALILDISCVGKQLRKTSTSLLFIKTNTYMDSSRAKCFEDWFLRFILFLRSALSSNSEQIEEAFHHEKIG